MVEERAIQKIRVALKDHNISQNELARRAQVANGTLTKILNEPDYKPGWDIMCRIADVLGLSLDSLRKP